MQPSQDAVAARAEGGRHRDIGMTLIAKNHGLLILRSHLGLLDAIPASPDRTTITSGSCSLR